MTVLLDTSILVDHLHGAAEARAALERLVDHDERVVGSTITRLEVLAGTRPEQVDAVRALLDLVEWVDVDATIADLAGSYMVMHRDAGLDLVDAVLAATATHHHAVLWSADRQRFPMFPALPDPYAREIET